MTKVSYWKIVLMLMRAGKLVVNWDMDYYIQGWQIPLEVKASHALRRKGWGVFQSLLFKYFQVGRIDGRI